MMKILLMALALVSFSTPSHATDPDLLTVGAPTGASASVSLSSLTFGLPVTWNGPKTYTFAQFGATNNGTADDDLAAIQAAINSPYPVTCEAGNTYYISARFTLGNGSTSAFATVGNNKRIDWGGGEDESKAMYQGTPGFPTGIGCRIVFLPTATPDVMFEIKGPLYGTQMSGTLYLDGNLRATQGILAKSFNAFSMGNMIVVNTTEKGVEASALPVTNISGQYNGLASAANRWGTIWAFNPYQDNWKAVILDGYKAAGGQDVTHNFFGLIKTGVSEKGGIGLTMGYMDANKIDFYMPQMFDDDDAGTDVTAQSGAADIMLEGSCTPFCAPEANFIDTMVLTPGGIKKSGTPGQLEIRTLALDYNATIPSGSILDNVYIDQVYAPGTINHKRMLCSPGINCPRDGRRDVMIPSAGEYMRGSQADNSGAWHIYGDSTIAQMGSVSNIPFRLMANLNEVLFLDTDRSVKHWNGASRDTIVKPDSSIGLPSLSDSAATNSSLYYSTTQSKPVWKDSGGVVRVLY